MVIPRALTSEEAGAIAAKINERGVYKATVEDGNLVLVVTNDDTEAYIADCDRLGDYELLFDQETGRVTVTAPGVE